MIRKINVFIIYFMQIGETIKIVIEDYVQHLSGYHFKLKFDPELLFNKQFQYQNRIAAEFNTLYHWHPLLPDNFQIHDQKYNYQQFIYNNSILLEHGITQFVESFTRQIAGRVSIIIENQNKGLVSNFRISATEIIFLKLTKRVVSYIASKIILLI